jgi:hypothetical protein
MSALINKQIAGIHEVDTASDKLFHLKENTDSSKQIIPTKFNLSMERKIENLFLESKKIGLSYNCFLICLLEIAIVLNHRKNMK